MMITPVRNGVEETPSGDPGDEPDPGLRLTSCPLNELSARRFGTTDYRQGDLAVHSLPVSPLAPPQWPVQRDVARLRTAVVDRRHAGAAGSRPYPHTPGRIAARMPASRAALAGA